MYISIKKTQTRLVNLHLRQGYDEFAATLLEFFMIIHDRPSKIPNRGISDQALVDMAAAETTVCKARQTGLASNGNHLR